MLLVRIKSGKFVLRGQDIGLAILMSVYFLLNIVNLGCSIFKLSSQGENQAYMLF